MKLIDKVSCKRNQCLNLGTTSSQFYRPLAKLDHGECQFFNRRLAKLIQGMEKRGDIGSPSANTLCRPSYSPSLFSGSIHVEPLPDFVRRESSQAVHVSIYASVSSRLLLRSVPLKGVLFLLVACAKYPDPTSLCYHGDCLDSDQLPEL